MTDVELFLNACGTADATRAKYAHPRTTQPVDAGTAARVLEARTRLGLTQAQAGRLAGVCQNTYRQVEAGGRATPAVLSRVLAALGLQAEAGASS